MLWRHSQLPSQQSQPQHTHVFHLIRFVFVNFHYTLHTTTHYYTLYNIPSNLQSLTHLPKWTQPHKPSLWPTAQPIPT
ncbi:hypothetical protein ACN38_g4375 [Penicillium nordicum]|uniref:Uncharacterized protein n=1 Tax=Penicillium nordicum TaxID=229535 RepID=A0A0M8P429_9EURO|nr:hypothetical protein ACN38_g4375 [Penicillium nordicum]